MELLAPLIVEQIIAVLMRMVDVVMVATVGEAAVSGVLPVDSISVLIVQIMGALATGGAVISAQYLGKAQPRDARKATGQLVTVTLALLMVVAGIAILENRHLLGTIFGRVETSIMGDAQAYFWITALSYPLIGLCNACAALFRSMSDSKVSMMISLVMSVINIMGNVACVFSLGVGVAGVAYPTLLGRIIAAAMILVLIQNRHNSIRLNNLKLLVPDTRMIKNILSIGVPDGLESGMFQFGKIFPQSLMPPLGTAVIANYAAVNNLVTILYLPGTVVGLRLITIMGQCMGAGRLAETKHYAGTLMGVNYRILAVPSTAMVVFSGQLVGIYHLSERTSRLLRELTTARSVAMILQPLAFTIPHTLRASLDMKFTMAVAMFSIWAFHIGFTYLFVDTCRFRVMRVWYSMFIDWVFHTFVFSWRFRGFEKRAVAMK